MCFRTLLLAVGLSLAGLSGADASGKDESSSKQRQSFEILSKETSKVTITIKYSL